MEPAFPLGMTATTALPCSASILLLLRKIHGTFTVIITRLANVLIPLELFELLTSCPVKRTGKLMGDNDFGASRCRTYLSSFRLTIAHYRTLSPRGLLLRDDGLRHAGRSLRWCSDPSHRSMDFRGRGVYYHCIPCRRRCSLIFHLSSSPDYSFDCWSQSPGSCSQVVIMSFCSTASGGPSA